jgi:hypothetical protein
LAASISVMPASAGSWPRRSCSVPNVRSNGLAATGARKDACLSTGYAANRPRYARRRIARAPGRPGSDHPDRSRRQLSGVKIMRPAIGVAAHRQAALGEQLLQRPEGRGRALLVDQKRRIDRPVASSSVTMRSGAAGPRGRRAASRPCSVMPGSGRRSRLRRCAPLRAALDASPAQCRCSFSPV